MTVVRRASRAVAAPQRNVLFNFSGSGNGSDTFNMKVSSLTAAQEAMVVIDMGNGSVFNTHDLTGYIPPNGAYEGEVYLTGNYPTAPYSIDANRNDTLEGISNVYASAAGNDNIIVTRCRSFSLMSMGTDLGLFKTVTAPITDSNGTLTGLENSTFTESVNVRNSKINQISLSGMTKLKSFINSAGYEGSYDFTDVENVIESITIGTNPNLGSTPFVANPLQGIFNSTSMKKVSVQDAPGVNDDMDLSNMTALEDFRAEDSGINSLLFGPLNVALGAITVFSNNMSAAAIDTMLDGLVATGLNGKTVTYHAQAGDGHLDVNRGTTAWTTLSGRGWVRGDEANY